jgi:hypothetical protein
MKTNWKTKLKTELSVTKKTETSPNSILTKADNTKLTAILEKDEFSELSLNSQLTKADKTQLNLVSTAFVSGQSVDIPENKVELAKIKTDYFHSELNRFIEAGITFDVSADDFLFIDTEQTLKISDMEFLKLNRAAILCQLQQSLLMKHLFSHSPEQFEDFAFEITERESLLTITAKTRYQIYCEAVKDVTAKWFNELLNKKEKEC